MNIRVLETSTAGKLYLYSMPGRYEPLSDFVAKAESLGIRQIVCLNSDEEVARKSPEYSASCKAGAFPVPRTIIPILDFGVPEDKAAFYTLINKTAGALNNGDNILVHCAGGIGRTGMFAGCILMALKLPLALLEESGSYPEEEDQMSVIKLLNQKE